MPACIKQRQDESSAIMQQMVQLKMAVVFLPLLVFYRVPICRQWKKRYGFNILFSKRHSPPLFYGVDRYSKTPTRDEFQIEKPIRLPST